MRYMDAFSKQGIRLSVRQGNLLWFDPASLVTDKLMTLARERKDAIIQEIRASAGSVVRDESHQSPGSTDTQEIVPTYRFLWVATDLSSFEDHDPRVGYEVGRDPVFRMLDAGYYAWLRHRMEKAQKAHDAGRLSDEHYDILRERFNTIHTWAVTHIGEGTLKQAVRTTNVRSYVPLSDDTIDAYHRSWEDAQSVNSQRQAQRAQQPRTFGSPAAKLRHLISTRGYAVISSPLVERPMVYVRDESATVPAEYGSHVRFTIAELLLLRGADSQTLNQIYDIKDIIGGTVIGETDGQGPARQAQQPVASTQRATTQLKLGAAGA